MLRLFSDNCLSLDRLETVTRADLIRQQHILGPGVDYFTPDGKPVQPHPGIEELQRVFSGSTLDLNARGGGEGPAFSQSLTEDDGAVSAHVSSSPPPGPLFNSLFFHQNVLSSLPESIVNSPCASPTKEMSTGKAKANGEVVMVIGDNVYIATTIVAKLLSVGYSVRVTVTDSVKLSHYEPSFYTSQFDVAQRLACLVVDMTEDDSLAYAMKGCRYVIHCGCSAFTSLGASGENHESFLQPSSSHDHLVTSCPPCSKEDWHYPIEYSERAVKALFSAIRKVGASTIKRLIITGAYTSVFDVADSDSPSGFFNESCWNSKTTPEDDPAVYAKILFEREAWRLQRMIEVEMVVLLPAVPIGLSRTAETGECMQIIQDLAFTKFPFCPDLSWNFVDVQDVAECHIRAMESSDLHEGRVIVSTACLSLVELSGLLKKVRPSLSPPRKTLSKLPSFFAFLLNVSHFHRRKRLWHSLGKRKVLDNSEAKRVLNMEFTPLENALEECLERIFMSSSCSPPKDKERVNSAFISYKSNRGSIAAKVVKGISLVGLIAAIFLYKRRAQK